ncbi:hypothetical protein E1176_06800 [Fulvivirga sp. RKSG066]|uniref:hypothetical protein n=1 Tax=Fulvivirga aurantia TaxID=2529383 RepID=UPI0012BD3418|nr:hypothetical protein [Fulvivirga aurantia]MTI20724.1 hypothetical protein [Fulvivirga aurantia]
MKINLKVTLLINVLVLFLTQLIFIPGPSVLFRPANWIFNAAQLASIAGILLTLILIVWLLVERFAFKKSKQRILNSFGFLILTLCISTFLSTTYISSFTSDLSRNLAIREANLLIHKIEDYKLANGTYPHEIEELNTEIPNPSPIGIKKFHYERTEQSYKLTFQQNVIMGFNFEVVTYDPNNQHTTRGEMPTLYDTPYQNWKYYIYD